MLPATVIAIAAVAFVLVALLLVVRPGSAHRDGAPPDGATREPHPGDYVASGGRLYRIEHVRRERVLIEDCGNGDLFDTGLAEVRQLPLVKCGSDGTVSARTRRQARNGRLSEPRATGHRTV